MKGERSKFFHEFYYKRTSWLIEKRDVGFARQTLGGPRARLHPDEWKIKSANQVAERSRGRRLWKCYSKDTKINFLSFCFRSASVFHE